MKTPVSIGPASNGKTYLSQGVITGALLLAIRQTEDQRGELLAHHGRHPAALRPTQRRLHKVLDRGDRKLAARYRAQVAMQYQHDTGKRWGDLSNAAQFAQAGIVLAV